MSSRHLVLYLVLSAAQALAAPAAISVTGAPPIASAPDGGLDPDVIARLDAVERAVTTAPPGELGALLDRVLVLYESGDPFSLAQREAARPRSVAILTKLGERARAMDELQIAARAFDARWTIERSSFAGPRSAAERRGPSIDGEHRDVELAQVLTAWSERDAADAPARALYLARRARTADPSSSAAARLDDHLSSNHRVWPGRLAIVAGLAALAAGLWAQNQVAAIDHDLHAHPRPGDEVDRMLADRQRYDAIGTGMFAAAPVLSIGGVLLILSGRPSLTPTSPAELPALGAP